MKLNENLFNTNRSVRRTHLTEKLWSYQLPQELANNIRNSINDMEFQNVVDALIAAYEWMRNNVDIIDDEEIDMWIADLQNIDLYEDEIDYQLNEFYDLCDNIGIFVPFAEVDDDDELEEDIATPTTYTMGKETTNDQNKFYQAIGQVATNKQMNDLNNGKPVVINGKNYQIHKNSNQAVATRPVTNESYDDENDNIIDFKNDLQKVVNKYIYEKKISQNKVIDIILDWVNKDVKYVLDIDESLTEENKQDRTIPIEDCIITDEHLPDDDYWTEIYWKTHEKWGE